jgi:tripartite-type tricarboxylate transporter receptor subunit TctC
MKACRCLMVILVLVFVGVSVNTVTAAGFPSKPITLIVPYPAGGSTDVVIRPLAEAAGKILGQPVMVENKGGGGGAVGTGSIVGKDPDGYLLSVVVTSLHRAAHINKLSFDTVKISPPSFGSAATFTGFWSAPTPRSKPCKS